VLKDAQLLETAIAVAPCSSGEVQAVRRIGARWAKARASHVVVCG